jgi:hypothetical protein
MKPHLSLEDLKNAGFQRVGVWSIDGEDKLGCSEALPDCSAVYTFVQNGIAKYVGVTQGPLRKRMGGYMKPGPTQSTNIRVNKLLRDLIRQVDSAPNSIEIYYVSPEMMEWKGMPVHTIVGLEAGLIQKYHLEWNLLNAKDREVELGIEASGA